ncbi:MAG: DNA polymerase, partial [Planctomycetota bacterium]
NIPGVPKVGPKAAAALLEQFGTLDAVLEAAAADKIEKSRVLTKPVRENLKTHAESARVSRKLATLETDLPIDLDWADAEAGHADAGTLREIFERLGFKRFAEEARDGGDVPGTPDASGPSETTDGEIDWEVVDSPAAFDEFVTELKKQDKVCVDLETTDTAPAAADIVGWAVCWSAGNAYYLPVDGPPGSSVLDGDEVLKVIGGFLSSPDVTVTNQNLKYDAVVLARHGIEVANYGVDPMVGDYLLSAGERSHGLDALALRHLDRTLIKIDTLIGKGKQQKKMFEVEVDAAAEYAAEDAAVAWKLADVIEAKLRDEDLWDLYWDLERPLIPVLVGMETKGIRVDVPELEKQSEKLTARLEELEHEAHRLAGKPFNLGSPKQLREIFFDEMGLP